MFRDTTLGLALAETLSQFQSDNRPEDGLTPKQVEAIWTVFEEEMWAMLKDEGNAAEVVIEPHRETAYLDDPAPTSSSTSLVTDAGQFPLYRCVDGVWTIVLKDVDVTVSNDRREEKFRLDYLHVEVAEEQGLMAKRDGEHESGISRIPISDPVDGVSASRKRPRGE
jgi:hypothetical protein